MASTPKDVIAAVFAASPVFAACSVYPRPNASGSLLLGNSPVPPNVLGVSRTAFTPLPTHGGTALTNEWSNGEPRIVYDVFSNELIGFGFSDKLYAFKSSNLGSTWSFVDPIAAEVIGTQGILCIAQDSAGKIHALFRNGSAGLIQYVRIVLSRTGNLISGFSSEVKNVTLPGTHNTNADVRASFRIVLDGSGIETLTYLISDNLPTGNITLQMGKATSLTPGLTTDFVKLDGTPGTTTIFSTSTFNNHDHSAYFAQLGTSRDLWVFWGPTEAEFGGQDNTFTTRLQLTLSGAHAWTVGSPITMVGSGPISSPEMLCIYGTKNYVWLMYQDPSDGLSFDRVDAAGNYTHAAITSPDPTPDRNGWGVFSVSADETRIWAIWNTLSRGGPGVDDRTRQAFWNGSTWTLYSDVSPQVGDSWGMGGSLGWSNGVAAIRLNDPSFAISVASIQGQSNWSLTDLTPNGSDPNGVSINKVVEQVPYVLSGSSFVGISSASVIVAAATALAGKVTSLLVQSGRTGELPGPRCRVFANKQTAKITPINIASFRLDVDFFVALSQGNGPGGRFF